MSLESSLLLQPITIQALLPAVPLQTTRELVTTAGFPPTMGDISAEPDTSPEILPTEAA